MYFESLKSIICLSFVDTITNITYKEKCLVFLLFENCLSKSQQWSVLQLSLYIATTQGSIWNVCTIDAEHLKKIFFSLP